MKRIRKKMTAVLLSCSLLVTGIVGSYEAVNATGILAGVSAVEILEGILLSFGISVFTVDFIQTLTKDPIEDITQEELDALNEARMLEWLETEYERERKNSSGPSPSPTPGGDEPVPGEIPSFAEWRAGVVATGLIAMPDEVWDCMGRAVSNLWDNILGRVETDPSLPDFYKNFINGSGFSNYSYYSYYSYYVYNGSYKHFYMYKLGSFMYKSSSTTYSCDPVECSKKIYTYDDKLYSSQTSSNVFLAEVKNKTWISNLPIFNSQAEGLAWRNTLIDSLPKEAIWVHPDIADTYKNEGKLEYPQQAPQPLRIPTLNELSNTSQQLSPEAIQELINQLRENSSVDPEPTVVPNPDPTGSPNPTTMPEPTFIPEPTGIPEENIDPDDYKTDLRHVFPFCIPFDLIHLLEVFRAEPEAPVFQFPVDLEFNNPFTGEKILDYHEVFVLDMGDFEPVVKIFRIFQVIFFVIGLMMITRQHMIKG